MDFADNLDNVISVTVEREKNPDWNTLRKENEVRE